MGVLWVHKDVLFSKDSFPGTFLPAWQAQLNNTPLCQDLFLPVGCRIGMMVRELGNHPQKVSRQSNRQPIFKRDSGE